MLGLEVISKIYPCWTLREIMDAQISIDVKQEIWNSMRAPILVESSLQRNTLLLHINRILKRWKYDIEI